MAADDYSKFAFSQRGFRPTNHDLKSKCTLYRLGETVSAAVSMLFPQIPKLNEYLWRFAHERVF